MSTQKIVTKQLRVESAKSFLQTVQDNTASYYVFTGKHIPYEPDDTVVAVPNNSIQSSVLEIYNNMIFGKRVNVNDICHMIPNYSWEANTQFDMYDHTDGDLFDKEFYAVVDTGASYNIYKCLDNNSGANSTVEPSGTDVTPIYSPVDGYTWKYMYTVPDGTYDKFKTSSYVPVVVNTSVTSSAVAGTIEAIRIDDGGLGYDNYFTGEFRADDILINGSNIDYALLDTGSSVNDFYIGCIIKITSGVAIDEYKIITDYTIDNSSGKKIITLESPFDNTPSATDTYEIYPYVFVYGDGNETVNCYARAIISANTGNSVNRIEILNSGAGYRSANAVLSVQAVVDIDREASLTPMVSPPGGHGGDVLNELGANRIGVSVRFSNTENDYIPASNDYRTIGLIKDPLFNTVSVQLNTSNTDGLFVVGETARQYRDIVLAGQVSVNSSCTVVSGTNTYFDSSLTSGDIVHIAMGTQHFFKQVSSITSNTTLVLTSNVSWTSSNCTISLIDSSAFGTITSATVGNIELANVETKNITNDSKIYGETSHTVSEIDVTALLPVSINGVEVNGTYSTFVQLDKFVGALTSIGTEFNEDEVVSQDGDTYTTPTGYFHSFVANNSTAAFYVSGISRIFETNSSIEGQDSGAAFNLANKYKGDLVKDTGKILYIENVDPITRADNKSEIIKIILEY